MEPITLTVATALLSAVATDSWEHAKSAVVGLWRRARPDQAESVESDLVWARQQVLIARAEHAVQVEEVVRAEWQARLQSLLVTHPEVGELLREIVRSRWAGGPEDVQRAPVVSVKARASDFSRVYQAGGDLHIHGQ